MINETISHDEFGVFAAQTGGAYNFPGAYGVIQKGSAFPLKGSIPIATKHFGTITSEGTAVRGVGTQFGLLNPGDYLYHKDVVRQIEYIVSDTLLFLEQAFPSSITIGETPLICKRQTFKMVYAESVHATVAATLQEAPFPALASKSLSGGSPISYDATLGTIRFEAHT